MYAHKIGAQDMGTVNHGELIKPILPVEVLALQPLPHQQINFQGKWTLLYVSGKQCQQNCQQWLHAMRQIRLALGKDRDKVQRLWLTQQTQVSSWQQRYPHMLIAHVKNSQPWLNQVFIVDPQENLILRYSKITQANDIVSDMKRLLKWGG